MEWLSLIVLAFAIVGVVLAIRERRTGRGALLDETARDAGQTEADRERIRIEDHTIHR